MTEIYFLTVLEAGGQKLVCLGCNQAMAQVVRAPSGDSRGQSVFVYAASFSSDCWHPWP